MTSPSPPSTDTAIPDSESHDPDLPLTLASSIILTSLPRDAASALSSAGEFPKPKVTVHLKAVGSAPTLRNQVCKISSTQRFEAVVAYLRRVLKVGERDSVFLYVNSSFAPALDEVVGNLHRVSGSLSCLRVGGWGTVIDKHVTVLQGFQGPAYCHILDDTSIWMRAQAF